MEMGVGCSEVKLEGESGELLCASKSKGSVEEESVVAGKAVARVCCSIPGSTK